jgi:3-deoxy-D-manno-octulosonic-acid transferase
MHFLYSLLTAAAALLLSPYFLWRGLREGKYLHNLRQRLGHLPPAAVAADARPAIWLHAVSVGEVLAGLPLARRLREAHPQYRLVISTTTATGQRLARERMDFADAVFYFPLDWSFAVRRVLRGVRPALLVILETEIWPNVLRTCRRAGVPVVFVNGRISEKSFARYRKFLAASGALAAFVRNVLGDAALFLMQSEADADRLCALAAPDQRVAVTGNLKYDTCAPPATALVSWLGQQAAHGRRTPLVVAGSVVAGEEEPVLVAFDFVQRQHGRALLVLAPRKPEHFADAARIAAEDGWRVSRRSCLTADSTLPEDTDVLLLDSVGELADVYRLADAVFVGGSLVPAGGHNILEPALFGKPVCFGFSMENFRAVAELFLARGAAVQVETGAALGAVWLRLLDDATLRKRMGDAAQTLVAENCGATERSFARISALLLAAGDRP